jgi:hypothetical protein
MTEKPKKGNPAYKNIPIKAAKEIAAKFNKDMVIIVCWDKTHGRTHVTTYGKTLEDCIHAAEGGNLVKRAIGWPEEMCNAVPSRAKRRAK